MKIQRKQFKFDEMRKLNDFISEESLKPEQIINISFSGMYMILFYWQ